MNLESILKSGVGKFIFFCMVITFLQAFVMTILKGVLDGLDFVTLTITLGNDFIFFGTVTALAALLGTVCGKVRLYALRASFAVPVVMHFLLTTMEIPILQERAEPHVIIGVAITTLGTLANSIVVYNLQSR